MRESYTGVLERNIQFTGEFCTEPMEVAWATEARWFVQVLSGASTDRLEVISQVSPDGLTWCDLESDYPHSITGGALLSWPVSAFGGWLRLRGDTGDSTVKLRIYLSLKE